MADEKVKTQKPNYFAQFLGYFSPEEQKTLLESTDFGEFEQLWKSKGLEGASAAWTDRSSPDQTAIMTESQQDHNQHARGDHYQQDLYLYSSDYGRTRKIAEEYANKYAESWEQKKTPGAYEDPDQPKTKEEAYEKGLSQYFDLVATYNPNARLLADSNPADTNLSKAILRNSLRNKNLSFDEYSSIRRAYLRQSAIEWQSKDPSKRATLQDHLDSTDREFNDHLLLHSSDKAKQWAKQYNDPLLTNAIERKNKKDAELIKKSRVKRIIHKTGMADLVSSTKQKLTNSRTGRALSRIGSAYEKAWEMPGKSKNKFLQTRIGKIASRTNSRIRYVSGAPLRATSRVFNKAGTYIAGTKAARLIARGKLSASNSYSKLKNSFANSKLGRSYKKLKKIADLLNPISYLQRLFKKAVVGSAIGAIQGIAAFGIGALSGVIAGLGAALSGASAILAVKIPLIVGKIAAIITLITGFLGSLPISLPGAVIISLILIIVTAFAGIFFAPPEGEEIKQSPYPGIAYSVGCPQKVNNGELIKCPIIVYHNSDEANVDVNALSLVSTIPFGTQIVPSETSGNYQQTPGNPEIRWRLSENEPQDSADPITAFAFLLTLDPEDNVQVETEIRIEGAGENGGGGIVGGTCGGRWTSENAKRGNFGDPVCDYTKNGLGQLIRQRDPDNAEFWWLVADCESGHNPNAVNLDPDVPQRTGAWGAFQMGIEPGPPEYDGGNIPWRDQFENAFLRETKIAESRLYNNPFDYWQCESKACEGNPLCTNGEYNVQGRTW